MSTILVVEDDCNLRAALERMLRREGFAVRGVASGSETLTHLQATDVDLILCDYQMPGMNGLQLLEHLPRVKPGLPVIIMTGHGSSTTAIEAGRLGAAAYLRKPFSPEQLLQVISRTLALDGGNKPTVADVDAPPAPPEGIIGESPAMYHVYQCIGRVAATDVPVLIRGETGTGKELVARAVHLASSRRNNVLLNINCVAIPETLLESELFGHEKGAFTGAVARRAGKFELASGGTVFLDEIGDMPLTMQGKFLRVLEEKKFEALGGRQTLFADVRVVAATNADLEAGIASGRFRADLYQRLNCVTIWLPPLRERGQDIVLLAQTFLDRFSRELGMPSAPLSDPVKEVLLNYPWPGNVRELAHVLQRLLILNRGVGVNPDELKALLTPPQQNALKVNTASSDETIDIPLGMTLEEAERMIIERTVEFTGGNKQQAARLLGISRNTLYEKLKYHGLAKGVLNWENGLS